MYVRTLCEREVCVYVREKFCVSCTQGCCLWANVFVCTYSFICLLTCMRPFSHLFRRFYMHRLSSLSRMQYSNMLVLITEFCCCIDCSLITWQTQPYLHLLLLNLALDMMSADMTTVLIQQHQPRWQLL